ncbi:MAG: carbamoyltransferase HypF [Candidatus Omnitrophica bacterium]|nr:carbamoyltransferase HypF [Candidatus Omnitrophota bacterium]
MSNKTVLALGADIKNRFLLAKEKNLFFGPDIGDLSDAKNYEFFKKEAIRAIKKFKPGIVAHDLHPGYFSAKLAKELNAQHSMLNTIAVQHHYAHIASVICEHNLKSPVIGVSFDGAGYGTDGNMWGGEFLIAGKKSFKRAAHFKYRQVPGADKVVYEPWRMVLSILKKRSLDILNDVKKQDKATVLEMLSKNINSPLSSSVGRLFDAAAALLGICRRASYEAEGPIKLEAMCAKGIEEKYAFNIIYKDSCYIIDTDKVFFGMLKDIRNGKDKSLIAAKFHNSMADIIVKVCKNISKKFKIKDVALSGGVFQNKFLSKKAVMGLKAAGLRVFTNKNTSANDYNISLGQYYVSCNSGKN